MKTFNVICAIVGILLIAVISFGLGQIVAKRTNHPCHSITEDSVITDCSYKNGKWSPN